MSLSGDPNPHTLTPPTHSVNWPQCQDKGTITGPASLPSHTAALTGESQKHPHRWGAWSLVTHEPLGASLLL